MCSLQVSFILSLLLLLHFFMTTFVYTVAYTYVYKYGDIWYNAFNENFVEVYIFYCFLRK